MTLFKPTSCVLGTAAVAIFSLTVARAATAFPVDDVAAFTDRHCSACHNDVDKEAGLDLTSLSYAPDDPENFRTWISVHDRVQSGEMPPRDRRRPESADIRSFVAGILAVFIGVEEEVIAVEGRTLRRRLNRSEYESSLRDLFQAPWLQIQNQLPEDGQAYHFNKVSRALDVSYVHMQRYMAAADTAMRQVMALKLVQPPTTTTRYYARDERNMTQWLPNVNQNAGGPERMKFPLLGYQPQPDVRQYLAPTTVGASDPAKRELEASGWVSSNYVTGFGSRWAGFRASVAGRYKIRFSGFTVWAGPGGYTTGFANGRDMVGTPRPRRYFYANFDDIQPGRRSEYITIYTHGAAQNRRLGGIDIHPEVGVQELGEVYLLPNEGIVTDASRFFRSRPTGFQGGYTNPLAQRDGTPAVAFRWMEIEGPLYDDSTTAAYKLLFGDLPLKRVDESTVTLDVLSTADSSTSRGGGDYGRGGMGSRAVKVEVESANPEQDAERLLRSFMERAYRRPAREEDVQIFLGVIKDRLKANIGFAGSMLVGYTAVLASPGFVFVDEKPGKLDDYALATRLALFLWNSEPDQTLRNLAAKGELSRPGVLKTQTSRMLADPKSERFVHAFLDYWLELRKIEDTTPSTSLYNDYYLDEALNEASVEESRHFFSELLHKNLPARNIVDSDFTFLNERLATHYKITGVDGIKMRRVALAEDSIRGGFMTQASVLKVTANGTTTSPVIRGVWIAERIMGEHIPPPPAAVPAVEPDIRGAVTIREQLDKHRADESCAACHRKIDPPGFALESFDVMGAWRDRYRANAINQAPEHGFGKNGWPFAFHYALPVDASGALNDGRTFNDVREFKQLLLQNESQIARNLARQLTVYATGSPVRFSDRETIEKIVSSTKESNYGVRSIVDALIASDLFLAK